MAITFNSAGYKGLVAKVVNIVSNDSTNSNIYVTFNANVLTAFELTPPFLSFTDYKIDSTMTQKIRLKNTTAVEVSLLKIMPKDSQITARGEKMKLKPGEEIDLVVSFTPKKSTYFQGEIELSTDFESFPLIVVSVKGAIK